MQMIIQEEYSRIYKQAYPLDTCELWHDMANSNAAMAKHI